MRNGPVETIIFTFAELQLPENRGALAVLEDLRKCGTATETEISIPVECYRRAMKHRPPAATHPQSQPRQSPEDVMKIRGPLLWAELHRWALTANLKDARTWLAMFGAKLPCGECVSHWQKLNRDMPPDFSSNDALFVWTVRAHNEVNEWLRKPVMSIEVSRARWCE